MIMLRSLLFSAVALAWTVVAGLLYVPLLLGPRRWVQRGAKLWTRGLLSLSGSICGLCHRIEGLENLPAGPVIIAAKHQSAWDTFIFHQLVDDPIFVIKRELYWTPLVGWYLWKAGNIGIDRKAGFRAIRHMLPAARKKLGEGAQIIIFPEGTRGSPGASRDYHPGIAGLYERLDVPVVPVALNSGLYWGRRAFLKYPGTITLRILPPMPGGLSRRDFLSLLKQRIDEEVARLCGDGVESPGLVPHGEKGLRTSGEDR